MALPPGVVARGLSGRRVINLGDDVSEHASIDERAKKTPTPPRRKTTNRTRVNLNRLSTRPSAIPSFPSASLQPITNNPGLTNIRLPRKTFGVSPAGGQSLLMADQSNSPATPSIAVSTNPQQLMPSNTPSLQSGMGQLHHLAVGNLSHYGPHMPNLNQSIRPMLIVESTLPVIVRINMALTHSSICGDTFQRAASRSNGGIRVHPSPPPGQYTTTVMGYNPYGGEFTQLTLGSGMGNIGEGRDITLYLTIVDRGLFRGGNGGIEVDIVLGQDYLRLVSNQNMTIGLQGQFEGTQYPNQNYLGWPVAGRLQDVNIPPDNVGFPGYQTAANLASPEWGSANNHLHPQSQGVNPSSSWAMLSSQGGSLHPVAAPSMTGPDMSFGPTPLNQE